MRDTPTLLTAGQVAIPAGTPVAQPAPAKTGTGAPEGDGLGVMDVAQGGILAALLTTAGAVFGARALGRRRT